MHCSLKTFHFLSVSNGPTSILTDISVILWKSHETILCCIFEKLRTLRRYVFETSQRRHGIYIFFEICLRLLKDVTEKTSFFNVFETS